MNIDGSLIEIIPLHHSACLFRLLGYPDKKKSDLLSSSLRGMNCDVIVNIERLGELGCYQQPIVNGYQYNALHNRKFILVSKDSLYPSSGIPFDLSLRGYGNITFSSTEEDAIDRLEYGPSSKIFIEDGKERCVIRPTGALNSKNTLSLQAAINQQFIKNKERMYVLTFGNVISLETIAVKALLHFIESVQGLRIKLMIESTTTPSIIFTLQECIEGLETLTT